MQEVTVRKHACVPLAVLAILAIVGAPVMAAPANPASAPLGVIIQADHQHGALDQILSGATVYDGDRLETPEGGSLRANLGGPQLVLRQLSRAQVHSIPNGFSADLSQGTALVSSNPGQAFELLANGVTIRPSGSQPILAQITLVTPKELIITSTHGELKVTLGNEVRTAEPGNTYRLDVETASTSDPGPSGNVPAAGGSNKLIWVVIGGVLVLTTYGIIRALETSN